MQGEAAIANLASRPVYEVGWLDGWVGGWVSEMYLGPEIS